MHVSYSSRSFVNMASLVLATQNTSKLIIIRLQTYPKYKMWTTGTDRQENITGQREHRKTAENTPQDSKWMRVNLHSVTWKLERTPYMHGATKQPKQVSVLCM